MNNKFYYWRQISISERSTGTHTGRQAVTTSDAELPKMLVSMLTVLQIPLQLILAQS